MGYFIVHVHILLKIENKQGMRCLIFADCRLQSTFRPKKQIPCLSLTITQASLNNAQVSLFMVSSR